MPKFKVLPLFIGLVSPFTALASQPALEEVIVSADFRESSWLAAPVSVSVFDAQATKKRAATHLEEMLNTLPNVNFAAGSNRARYIQIRGIGERSQFKEPINPSVGLLIDGVDMSGLGSMATLFDIEQVEVIRGPQGTRYGANALAGLVKIKSVAPSVDQTSNLALSLATYGSHSLSLASGTTLDQQGKLSVRLALQEQQSDGFYSNKTLNKDNTNGRDEFSARFQVRYQPSEAVTLDWRLFGADIDNGYDAFTLDNTRNTLSDEPGHDRQESLGSSLSIAASLNSSVVFEGDFAYADSDSEYDYDEDWAYPTLAANTPFAGWEYSSFDNYLRDNTSQSVDLRLLSAEEGRILNGRSDWVIGFYNLSREQGLLRQYTYLAGDFTSQYDTAHHALYGQLDIDLQADIALSLGFRREAWSADYIDNDGLEINTDEDLWGANIGLQWAINEHRQGFINLSRGYKPGGVNTDGTLPEAERDFATEILYNTEVGFKWQSIDATQRGQLTIFHARRSDQQVKGAYVLARADGSTEFIDYVENAAKGKNQGVELEWQWLANDDLAVDFSAAYLDATFDRYLAPATQADPDGLDLSGRQQAHAPKYQAHLQLDYSFMSNWFSVVSVEAKDRFYFSDRHNAMSDAYVLFNAQLGYRLDDWSVRVWGRNLTNEDVYVRGFGSFGNDPRTGYEVGQYVQFGEPRVIGVSADWEF
jgi:iron complex outermembrane receptor protein